MLTIREIKAAARETLLGKYGTLIGARLLSGLLGLFSGSLAVFCLILSLGNTNRFGRAVQEILPGFVSVPALSVLFFVLFFFLLLFSILFSCWMDIGQQKLVLNICRGENFGVSDIFYAFRKGSRPFKVVALYIVEFLFIRINMLIPLIVKWMAAASGYRSYEAVDLSRGWGIALFVVDLVTSLWILFLSVGFVFAKTVIIDRPETEVIDSLRESLRITRRKKLKFIWFMITFFFWFVIMAFCNIAALWVAPFVEASVVIFYLSAIGEEDVVPALRTEPEPEIPEEPVTEVVSEAEEEAALEEETPGEAKEAPPEADALEESPAEPEVAHAEAVVPEENDPDPEEIPVGEEVPEEEPPAEPETVEEPVEENSNNGPEGPEETEVENNTEENL